jgi:hypothetical protein
MATVPSASVSQPLASAVTVSERERYRFISSIASQGFSESMLSVFSGTQLSSGLPSEGHVPSKSARQPERIAPTSGGRLAFFRFLMALMAQEARRTPCMHPLLDRLVQPHRQSAPLPLARHDIDERFIEERRVRSRLHSNEVGA